MASTYLSKTPSSTTNRKTFTISVWVKRAKIISQQCLFSTGNGTSNPLNFFGFASDQFSYWEYSNSTTNISDVQTNRLLRDTSAWFHLVASVDTTQATASDRIKLYVNGVQETSFSTATYPSQNADLGFNLNQAHNIGRYLYTGTAIFDGLMSHFHFIDGTAYDASTFGETDATTGIWKPKTEPSVTYGTNGFFLKFENSGSMGTDSSGNANNFTVNGTLTQTVDTPTNNFATLNAVNNYYPSATFSYGNTKITTSGSAPVMSTLGVSKGKWYWETKVIALAGNYSMIGIAGAQATASTQFLSNNANEYAYSSQGNLYYQGGSTGTYASYTVGDIIGVAMDLDNNRLFFSKNGTWQNSADPTTSTGAYTITAPALTSLGNYFPAITYWDDNVSSNGTYEVNFGNGYFGTTAVSSATTDESGLGIFEYTVPSGYYALCTKNINEQEYD